MHLFRLKNYLPLLLLTLTHFAQAQDARALAKVIKDILHDKRVSDSSKTKGIIIGVIDGDSTWTFGFGHLSATDATLPDAQTAFEVAGFTKVLIADALQDLDLSQKINTFLPQNLRFSAGEKITLLQLLTHRSGLPRLPNDIGINEQDKTQPYENYRLTDLKNYLNSIDSSKLDTGKYIFSHLNYELLGYVKNCWDSLASTLHTKAKNTAIGYDRAQKSVPYWQYGETFQHLSTTTTLEKILPILKKMKQDECKNGIFATNLDKNTFIALGWHVIQPRKNVWLRVATGTTGGFATFVGERTQTHTSVVVLSNSRLSVVPIGLAVLQSINDNWKRKVHAKM